MNQRQTILNVAMHYAKLGWHLTPGHHTAEGKCGKHPTVPWNQQAVHRGGPGRTARLMLYLVPLVMWAMTWRLGIDALTGSRTLGLCLDELLTWSTWLGLCALGVLSAPDWLVGRRSALRRSPTPEGRTA